MDREEINNLVIENIKNILENEYNCTVCDSTIEHIIRQEQSIQTLTGKLSRVSQALIDERGIIRELTEENKSLKKERFDFAHAYYAGAGTDELIKRAFDILREG